MGLFRGMISGFLYTTKMIWGRLNITWVLDSKRLFFQYGSQNVMNRLASCLILIASWWGLIMPRTGKIDIYVNFFCILLAINMNHKCNLILIPCFRFQLYYYANADFKKEERKETILTIDTRSSKNIVSVNANDDFDDAKEPALQLAIKTK